MGNMGNNSARINFTFWFVLGALLTVHTFMAIQTAPPASNAQADLIEFSLH